MAEFAIHAPAFLTAAAIAFSRVMAGLAGLAETIRAARAAEREIRRIDRETDAALALRGLTRAAAIRQVFARNFS